MSQAEIKKAIEKIERRLVESKESHLSWIRFYKVNPKEEERYADSVGDMESQEQCVKDYENAIEALALLRPLLAEPEATKFTKRMQEKYYPNYLGNCTFCRTMLVELREACGIIDRQDGELKRAYGRITALSLKEGRIQIADVYQQQKDIIERQAAELNYQGKIGSQQFEAQRVEIEQLEAGIKELQKDFVHEVDMASQAHVCCVRLENELKKLTEKKDAELSEIYVELELGLDHLEQALFYAVPPHPTAKERLKEAQKYLEVLRTKD